MTIPQYREPTPPGEILLEDFLNLSDLTMEAAADQMGVPVNVLTEIGTGARSVTADTASRLATLTGTTPQFWLNLQTAVDLYRARS